MIKTKCSLFKTSLASALLVTTLLSVTGSLCAAPVVAEKKTDAEKTEAKRQSKQKAIDKRKQEVSEAISALRETQDALRELDENKKKEALASLTKATGQLEIVLARNPQIGLLPIDVRIVTHNIYSSLETISRARQEAINLLNAGRVQEARAILKNLASEIVISTTNIPVATYPVALKTAAKLIDTNKIEEAKEVLQAAMDTLVVTEVVIPLPVANAKVFLQKAEELAQSKKRTTEESKRLVALLGAADTEIKYAEALGYGKKTDFTNFHKQIAEIRNKTGNGKFGTGFFSQINGFVNHINEYVESLTKK